MLVGDLARSGRTDRLEKSLQMQGVIQRAILGEAALTAILNMNKDAINKGPNTIDSDKIMADLENYVDENRSFVSQVAPHVRDAVLEPGFRVAVEIIREQNKKL